MKNRKKLWDKMKKAETELLSATPSQAAKLVSKIVKWRGQVLDER